MVDIRLIDTPAVLNQLDAGWRALEGVSRNRSVFLSWDWVSLWLRIFGAGFESMILAAYDRGRLCGIAPAVIRRQPARLEFIGQNKAFGEYLDLLIPEKLEPDVAPALCECLARQVAEHSWDVHLAGIPADSPNVARLTAAFAGAGVPLVTALTRPCPYVDLGLQWEDYLATRTSGLRRRVRYNARRIAHHGNVALEVATAPADVDPFFDDFETLHHRRWAKDHDACFFDFHRELAHILHRNGRLLLCRLRVGSTIVAAKYDFVFDGKVWGYQGGWLPEFARREAGSVLLCEIFQWAIDHGIGEYDFLEGDAWYKRRWATGVRHAIDLVHGPPESSGYIF